MQYRVFDDMSAMTQADVARMLPLVSIERREKALRYKHLLGQWTTLKSYEMLLDLLRETGYESDDSAWQYNEFGKPFLPDGPAFSLSHCRAGVAVVIDEHPIGIDIETIRPYNDSLARRVMNEEEMRMIDEAAVPLDEASLDEASLDGAADKSLDERAVMFTRLWTQKEAVLKLRGTGIVDDLRDVLTGAPERLTTWVNKEKQYVLTIAEL